MKLVGMNIIRSYQEQYPRLVSQLNSWVQEVKTASWKNSHEIKDRYSSADFFKNNQVVINLKGNHYRMLFQVNYQLGIVAVKKIGTHTEYDKWVL